MRCTVSSIGCGPWLQLAPTTSRPVLEGATRPRACRVERRALFRERHRDRDAARSRRPGWPVTRRGLVERGDRLDREEVDATSPGPPPCSGRPDRLVERNVRGVPAACQGSTIPPPGRRPWAASRARRAPSRLICALRLDPGAELEAMRAKVLVSTMSRRLEYSSCTDRTSAGLESSARRSSVHEDAAGIQHRAHGAVAHHTPSCSRSRKL